LVAAKRKDMRKFEKAKAGEDMAWESIVFERARGTENICQSILAFWSFEKEVWI
jgi:hypothetical protein